MKNKALDDKALHVLQEPEDLHQTVKIIPLPFWLVTVLIFVIMLTLIAWGVFGEVYTEVNGEGIILPEPAQVYVADSQHGGLLEQVFVKSGQQVKKGQLLAQTNQTELKSQIRLVENYIQKLKTQQTQVQDEWDKYKQFTNEFLNRLTTSIKQKKADALKHQDFLKGLLTSQEGLRKQGVITILTLENTQVELFRAMESLRESDQEHANVLLNQENSKLNWLSEYNQITLKILEQKNRLEHLKLLYQDSREIYSPISGEVDQLLSSVGQVLTPGSDVVSIVQAGHQRNLVAFLKPDMGKRVKVGMKAFVSPTTVNRSRYGSIKGVVESVSAYPASEKAIFAILADKRLTQRMLHDGGSLVAHIRLEKSAHNLSGFQWTSKGGPPFNVSSGTISRLEVVIEKQHPIVLVLPFLKSLVTGEQ